MPTKNPGSSPCSYCPPLLGNSHTIFTCFKLEKDKKNAKINATAVWDIDYDEVFINEDDYENDFDEDEEKSLLMKKIPPLPTCFYPLYLSIPCCVKSRR